MSRYDATYVFNKTQTALQAIPVPLGNDIEEETKLPLFCRRCSQAIFESKLAYLESNSSIIHQLIKSTISQLWFRWWLGADQATSHYLDQWWLDYRRIYASLGLNELTLTEECKLVLDYRQRVTSRPWPNLFGIRWLTPGLVVQELIEIPKFS